MKLNLITSKINLRFYMFSACININISAATTSTATVKTQVTKPKIQITSAQTLPTVKTEADETLKRKREDDDYDVP